MLMLQIKWQIMILSIYQQKEFITLSLVIKKDYFNKLNSIFFNYSYLYKFYYMLKKRIVANKTNIGFLFDF